MIANHLLNVPADYQHLPVPIPPMLEQAIGYAPGEDHQADFVSFFFSGNKPCWDDGAMSASSSYYPYSVFTDHQKVAPFLVEKTEGEQQQFEPTSELGRRLIALGLPLEYLNLGRRYNLGSSDEEHTYRLLLDVRTRLIYVLPKEDARDLLKRQWTPDGNPPRQPTQEEREEAIWRYQAMQEARREPNSDVYKQFHQPISMADLHARVEAERELCQKMQEWLDTNDYQPPVRPS